MRYNISIDEAMIVFKGRNKATHTFKTYKIGFQMFYVGRHPNWFYS